MRIAIIIFSLLVSTLVFSQDGELDLSFADNGIFNPSNLNFHRSLLDLSVDSSNNIFISGNVVNTDGSKSIMVIKLLPNGSIDTNFGNSGYSYIHYNPTAYVSKNIVLENGKIILVGWLSSNTNDFLIIGLNADGSLDSNFGDNGRVTIDSGFGDDRAFTIAEHNNALFIGGQLWNEADKNDFSVVKLDLNGNLDSSFGINGIARLSVPKQKGFIYDLLITDSGNIVACGKIQNDSRPYYDRDDLAVLKFDANGNVDSSFGNNGFFTIIEYEDDQANSIKKHDDFFYVTGHVYQVDTDRIWVIVIKLDEYGALDMSFGTNGQLRFHGLGYDQFYFGGYSSIIQDDAKLIIGGTMNDPRGIVYKRINSDGTMDQNFGTEGSILFDFPFLWWSNRALSKQFDDKFLSLSLDEDFNLFMTRHNIDQSLSIHEEEISNQEYLVYPNPASQQLFIKKPTGKTANGILYDITGKLISKFPLNDFENKIDVSNIASGIYFMEISNIDNSVVKKIVIE